MYGARGLSRDAENILQLTREQQEQLGRANRDEDDWQMDLSQWKAKRRKSKNASVTSSGETLPPPSLVDSFDNVFGDSNLSPSEGKPIPDKKDSFLAKADIAADDFDALVEANKKHAGETNGEPLITSSMLTINMEQPKQAPPTKPAVSQSPKKADPMPTNKLSTLLPTDTKPTNQRSPSTAETNVSKDNEKPKYVSESLEYKTNTPAYYQPANAYTSKIPEPAVSVEKPVEKPVVELPLAIETLTWQLESSPDILSLPKLDVQVNRPNKKDNFSEGLHMVIKTTKDADAGEGDKGGGTSSDSDESSCPPPPPLPPSPPPNPPARRESLDSLLKYAATSAAAPPSVGDVTAPIPGEKRKLTRTQREAQRKRNELLGIPLTEEMERDSNDDEVEQISQHNTEAMQDHVDLDFDRGQLLLGNNAYVSKLDDVFITSDTNNNKPTDSKAAETSKENGVVQPANDHIVLLAHHKPTPVKINYRSRSRDWRPPITSGENITSNSNIRPTDRQQPIEKVEQPKQHSTTNAELPRSKPDSSTSQPIRSKNNDVIQTSRNKPQFATEDVRLSVRETRAKTTVVQPQPAVSTSLIGQPLVTAPAIGQPNFTELQQPRLVDRQPFSERLRETNNSKSALLTITVPLKLEDSPARWTAANYLQRHNSLPEMGPRPQTANQTSSTPTRSTAANSVQVSHLPYRDWLNLASSNNQLSWSAYAITGSKKPSPTTNQYKQHNQYRGRPATANTDRYTPSRRSQSENSRPQSAANDWPRGSRDYNPNQWRNVPSSTPTKAINNVNQSTARFYGSNDNFDRRPRSSHSPQRHNNNYYNKDERKYYSDNEASTKRNHYTVYPSHAANDYARGNSTVLPNNAYNNNNNNNKENWDAWTGHTMEAKMRRRDAQRRFQEMENDLLQQQTTGSGHHVVRRHTVSSPQAASRLPSSSPSSRYSNGISPNSPNRRYNGSYGYNGTNDNSHLQQQFSSYQSPSQHLHPLQQQQQQPPSPGKPVPSDELFRNYLSPKPKRVLQQSPTDVRQTVQGPPKPQRTHNLPYPLHPPQTPTSPQSNGVPIVAMKTRGQGQGHPPVYNDQHYPHQLRRTGSVPQFPTHRRSAPPSTLMYQQPLPSNRQDYASQPIRRQLTPTNYNTGSQYQLVGSSVHRSQSARNIQSQSYYVPPRHNDGLFQAPPYPVNHRQAPPPPLIIRSSADQLDSSPVSPSLFNGAPRPKERVMPPSSPTKINTQTPPTQLSPINLATRPSQLSPVTSQPPPIKPQLFASTATSPTNQRHADVTGKPTLPKFVLPSVPAATVSPGPVSPVRSVHEPVSRRDIPPDDVIPLSPRTPVGSTQHLSPALLSYNLGQSSVQLEPEKFCAACNQQIDTLGQYHTLPDEANIYFHTDCFHCSVCLTKLNTQANIHLRNGKLHCRHCDSNDLGLKLSSV